MEVWASTASISFFDALSSIFLLLTGWGFGRSFENIFWRFSSVDAEENRFLQPGLLDLRVEEKIDFQ